MSEIRVPAGDNSYIKGLNARELAAVLDGDTAPYFNRLRINAQEGDANSIELLLNLSVSANEATSFEAQQILFNTYSDPDNVTRGLSDRIAKDAARFCQDHERTISPAQGDNEPTTSSKLLALAAVGAKLDKATNLFERVVQMLKSALLGIRPLVQPLDRAHAPDLLKATIDALSASAANGAPGSAELLLELALNHDEVGHRAESALFDIFSGRTASRPGVADAICAHVSGAVVARQNAGAPLTHKLLYIAGASTEPRSTQRNALAAVFRQQLEQAYPVAKGALEPSEDPWSAGRFLDDQELKASLQRVAPESDPIEVFSSIPLTHLNYQIDNFHEVLGRGKSAIFVPVNTGNHWVSVILRKGNADGALKAVLFDSQGVPDGQIARNVRSQLALSDDDLTEVTGLLQGNAPNACGLFTITALEKVAENIADPAGALRAFKDEFTQSDDAAQSAFNINGRRRIMGNFIDDLAREKAWADEQMAASNAVAPDAGDDNTIMARDINVSMIETRA